MTFSFNKKIFLLHLYYKLPPKPACMVGPIETNCAVFGQDWGSNSELLLSFYKKVDLVIQNEDGVV